MHSCLESLEGAKRKALERVSRDSDRVSEYFDKFCARWSTDGARSSRNLETLKLAVMQTFDPEINQLRSALEEQQRAARHRRILPFDLGPAYFPPAKCRTSGKSCASFGERRCSRGLMWTVGLHGLQSFDVKEWDRVRLGEVDKLCAPYESSTYLASLPPACRSALLPPCCGRVVSGCMCVSPSAELSPLGAVSL